MPLPLSLQCLGYSRLAQSLSAHTWDLQGSSHLICKCSIHWTISSDPPLFIIEFWGDCCVCLILHGHSFNSSGHCSMDEWMVEHFLSLLKYLSGTSWIFHSNLSPVHYIQCRHCDLQNSLFLSHYSSSHSRLSLWTLFFQHSDMLETLQGLLHSSSLRCVTSNEHLLW